MSPVAWSLLMFALCAALLVAVPVWWRRHEMTATDPPHPLPWLCRLDLHDLAYTDTTGQEIAPGRWLLRTVPRCNRCHREVGPPQSHVYDRPRS